MSANSRVILMRFARSLAAVAVAAVAAFVVGPDALAIVPDEYDWAVIGIAAPALLAVEKWLRDGGDARS